MKLILKYLSFCSVLLLLGGCFEITEEVDMNNDGSGKILLTMDMSVSKENLTNMMKEKQISGFKVPTREEIDMELEELKKILMETKGMSNVKSSSDYNSFIFTMSGNFTDTKVLNKAINKIVASYNDTPLSTPKKQNFSYSKNQFARYFKYRLSKGLYDKMDFGQRFVLDASQMRSIYRFQKPIKQFSNQRAKVSQDKKTIQFYSSLAEIAKGEVTIANDIIFE